MSASFPTIIRYHLRLTDAEVLVATDNFISVRARITASIVPRLVEYVLDELNKLVGIYTIVSTGVLFTSFLSPVDIFILHR